jgi:prepilin peptidase CpaA
MNLVATAPTWLLLLLVALVLAAAVEDAVRLRISNFTCAGVLLLAIVAMFVEGLTPALWQNGVVFLALLVLGTLVFAAGQMGGGDVKLLAALGAWVNLHGGVWLLSTVLLAGGLLALAFILVRVMRGGGIKRSAKGGVPYGLAIAAGAAITFAAQRGLL